MSNIKALLETILFLTAIISFVAIINVLSDKKKPLKKLAILNFVNGQIILMLLLMSFLMGEPSFVDMSYIYILIGPIATLFVMIFYKYLNKTNKHVQNDISTIIANRKNQNKSSAIKISKNNYKKVKNKNKAKKA